MLATGCDVRSHQANASGTRSRPATWSACRAASATSQNNGGALSEVQWLGDRGTGCRRADLGPQDRCRPKSEDVGGRC